MDNNISQNPFERNELKMGKVSIEEPVVDENLFKEAETEVKETKMTKEALIKMISTILLILTLILFIFFLYEQVKKSEKEYHLDRLKFKIDSSFKVKTKDLDGKEVLELTKGSNMITISLVKEDAFITKLKNQDKMKAYEKDKKMSCELKMLLSNYLDCKSDSVKTLIIEKKNQDHLYVTYKGDTNIKEEAREIAMNARYS